MKKRVYIETTVVSYFAARPSRDIMVAAHQAVTRELWPQFSAKYEPYISALVLEESGRGDPEQSRERLAAIEPFPMLDINDEVRSLADQLIANRGIPAECPEDALHISVAAVNGMDAILTWNIGHLNNPFSRKTIRKVIEGEGYECPEVCSPEELFGG